jgi:hemolysin III
MTLTDLVNPPPHYPSTAAWCADLVVHVVGLTLSLVGGGVLLALSARAGQVSLMVGCSIYAVGVVAMLAFSTAYNFASDRYRPMLRRLDHAGIFVMIAGSYTPFTLGLPGAWGPGMTTAVWTIASLGVLMKLLPVRVPHKLSVALYLALGWLIIVAVKPMIDTLAWYALILLLAGGVLYSTGVIFYVNKRLKFARAIWHGHVVAAAVAHWCAVLLGVVLAAR